jgi:hypothetical protein
MKQKVELFLYVLLETLGSYIFHRNTSFAFIHMVSDCVADFVMSSLKTCNMNCGSCWEGGREEREQRVGS